MRNFLFKKTLIKIYEVFFEYRRLFYLRTKYRLRIMSSQKTIKYIKRNKCSIARFGDGEFDLILKSRDQWFQKRSEKLSVELIRVLRTKNEKLLLCVPRCLNTVRNCNDHSKNFWIEWGRRNGHHMEIVEMIRSHAGTSYVFGDAQITRPYIDWKTEKRACTLFPELKTLWKDKRVLIVEGDQTRLGVGNDLFDGAKEVQRILAPAEGAFEVSNDIRNTIIEHYNGQLVLLALGPTATILAAELSEKNIQALDIGNIDIEYEWFLRGAKERIAIPGKYTTEAKDAIGRAFTECNDEKYLNEIIERIYC